MYAGLQVYIELGLSTPRYRILNENGPPVVVYRSGAEKVYLKYIYKSPLISCMYGMTYILIGGTAANSIMVSNNILSNFYPAASLDSEHRGKIMGTAIATLFIVCLIHGSWRTGGIYLNNVVAMIKTAFLVACIAMAFRSRAEPYESSNFTQFEGLQHASSSFSGVSKNLRGHAVAINLILYSMTGFEIGSQVRTLLESPRLLLSSLADLISGTIGVG